MDREDGQDVRSYDSAEAIAASQWAGEEAPIAVREGGLLGSTIDDPRAAGGIGPDELRYENSADHAMMRTVVLPV
jgi:hypothetical protein